jgi:hypothetical protein
MSPGTDLEGDGEAAFVDIHMRTSSGLADTAAFRSTNVGDTSG